MSRWSAFGEADQNASITRLKTLLIEEEALSEDWAEKIINSFSVALIPPKPSEKSKKAESREKPIRAVETISEQSKPLASNEEAQAKNVLLLFTSATDSKSVMAKKLLNDASFSYKCIDINKSPAVAVRFSAQQPPVLIEVTNGAQSAKMQGVREIEKYLRRQQRITKSNEPEPAEISTDIDTDDETVVPEADKAYLLAITDQQIKGILGCESAHEMLWTKASDLPVGEKFKSRKNIELLIVNGRDIEEGSFEDCENLRAVYISSCQKIGMNAFSSCKLLKYVIIDGDSNPSAGSYVFDCCPNARFFYTREDGRYTCNRIARTSGCVFPISNQWSANADSYAAYILVQYARKRIAEPAESQSAEDDEVDENESSARRIYNARLLTILQKKTAREVLLVKGKNERYTCPICGFIHTGDAAPQKCQICGAPGSKFLSEPRESFRARQDIDVAIVDGLPIDKESFKGCSNLRIVFISSCSTIGPYSFAYCRSLKYVIFDGYAPSVDSSAFEGCPKDTKFVYNWNNRYSCKRLCERFAKHPDQAVLFNPNDDSDLTFVVDYARKQIK